MYVYNVQLTTLDSNTNKPIQIFFRTKFLYKLLFKTLLKIKLCFKNDYDDLKLR